MAKSNLSVPVHPEIFRELLFPAKGIDLSNEISAQIPGTTPLGHNVRLNEPLTLNARGGSRPGLSKYIPGLVNGSTASKIQDLDTVVIVDSSATGSGTGGGFQPVTHTTRTHTPFWRTHGSGHRLTRVQRKIQAYPSGHGPFTLAFDNPVVAGNLIWCSVASFSVPSNINTHAVNSTRNSFTQIGGFIRDETSAWWGIANTSGADTISVQPAGLDGAWFCSVAIMEYGNNLALPLDGSNTNTATIIASPQSLTAGNVSVSQADTIISVFVTDDPTPGLTADTGWNLVQKVDGADAADVVMYIFDGDFSVLTAATCTYNGFGGGDYDAISASFKAL